MAEPVRTRRWHLRVLRRLWHLAVLLLVMLAVYQTGGRIFMARLGGQQDRVAAQLSQLLRADVTIGELRGSWFRFSPAFELDDLVIVAPAGERHALRHVTVELDAVDSLLETRPAVTRIHAEGVDIVVQQDASGRWSLAGLPRGTGPDYSRQIVDFLLQTRGIDFAESQLRVQRSGAADVTVSSLYIDMRNRGGGRDGARRYEMESQFRVNGQASPSRLRMTLDGDPRGEFDAEVYAVTTGLELAPLLPLPASGTWQLQQLAMSGEAWLSADHGGIRTLRATVTDLGATALHTGTQRSIALEHATFAAWLQPDSGLWKAGIADLAFDLQQTPWELPELQLQFAPEDSTTLTLRAASLDAGLLTQVATLLPSLPANVATIIDTMNPRGTFTNLRVDTALDGSYPGGFELRANVVDAAVDAWSGAPAGRGVQGYVQANARGGFVEVDSDDFDLHLPRLFAASWHYDHVNARVHWSIADGGFRIGSSAIDVRAEGLDGTVRFDLYNTRDDSGARVSELMLLVGMRSMDVGLRSAYLPTLPRLKPTMDWLQTALQGGRISNSGFVLRTSTLPNAPRDANTYSTWYEVEDGTLQFLPDWPALENIRADVTVRDGHVDVRTQTASIAGMALNPSTGTVVPQPEGGSLLRVRGTASTDTGTGLAFLRESPVREAIGPVIDTWLASGAIDVDVALDIPLGMRAAASAGEAVNEAPVIDAPVIDAPVIDVRVQSNGSQLVLSNYALTIDEIHGLVRYHSTSGLAADDLDARMFDFPVVASIETRGDATAGRSTRVTSTGRASVSALQAWERQPEFVKNLLGYMGGEISYAATLDILHQPGPDGVRTRLQLASDLAGLRSDLPQPFQLAPQQTSDLQLELSFLETTELLTVRYGDFASGRLILDSAGIDRGQVFFGERNRNFNIRQSDENTPGLLLSGELDYFNYDDWQAVADAMAAKATGGGRALADYLRLVDMRFGTFEILGQALEDIDVHVEVDTSAWQIHGSNALLAGVLTIPRENAPWSVNLDYLRFPAGPEPELDANGKPIDVEKVDLLEAVDPSTLPPFDFAVAELRIGEQGLGAFDFSLRPGAQGAAITDFRMHAPDSGITNIAKDGGAFIDWRYRNGVHASTFNGVFSATNLAQVLPRWGHGANVESRQASFSGMLHWDGSPLAFALRDTSGELQLDIRDGRFVEIQAGTARVLGALNFDALVRRLQLDFSDIFQSGYNFDSISASLALERGVVTTRTPAVIDGPSSKISINGEIDLAQETIAADMEVQIPLGQNVSMLAGLLGAWPLALSTYLASIIFADTVADFATVIYRLDGPWENPSAGFEAPAPAVTPPQAP
ncbi:MAG TPA: YhdP family protein [Pseudomonadales bacterium]